VHVHANAVFSVEQSAISGTRLAIRRLWSMLDLGQRIRAVGQRGRKRAAGCKCSIQGLWTNGRECTKGGRIVYRVAKLKHKQAARRVL